jgi:phosphoglucosamine mutase
VNVKVTDKAGLSGNEAIARAIAAAEEALGSDGRVLVRPSGTEPLIRVMVEAATNEVAAQHANAIAQVVEDELA